MKARKVQHSHHPKYQQYDLALAGLKKAEALWFKIINNKDSKQDRVHILENLSLSKSIFITLSQCQFLSANSYLEKVELMYQKLGCKQVFDEAQACLRSADKASDVYTKRSLYQDAERKFFTLGKFYSAAFFAKKAGQKYLETFSHTVSGPPSPTSYRSLFFFQLPRNRNFNFNQRAPVDDETVSKREFEFFIEDGHDLCLRTNLPFITQELHTTTIITPGGAYQLNEEKKNYIRILDSTDLEQIELGAYLLKAKELREPRISIRSELTQDQLKRLDQALCSKGGRSLEGNNAPRQQFRVI